MMWLQQIWRYPVKSMAGEALAAAELTRAGVAGDRIVQVRNQAGRIGTARSKPALLGHHDTPGPYGEQRLDGRDWRSTEVALDVEAAARRVPYLVSSE